MIEEAHQTPVAPDATDRRGLLEVLSLAFRDNPMNMRIHGPRPAHRLRANRAGLRALVLDTDRSTISRVIRHEDRVVGGFVAVPPAAQPLPRPRLRYQFGCFIHQGVRAMDEWGQVSAALDPFRPTSPHWYLAVLGVEPGWQGRGVGGRLLESMVELARADEALVYLESDRAESVRFYRGRGFSESAETSVHGVSCWCLRLDPSDVA